MKVLIYGGGAREHALVEKIKESPLLTKLYLACPNDGFCELGEEIEFENFENLAFNAKIIGITLLIVGPEDPLINGIVDEFKKVGISAIGPDKNWAMLEGSKAFAKEFMQRNNIPTAGYSLVSDKNKIDEILKTFNFPLVLKADGLAAGKGVSIVNTFDEARLLLNEFLDGKFGQASKSVVVEEFLEGEEVSLISIWDGQTLLPLVPARDYKKLLNDNEGPNTGGMGAYCPVTLTNDEKFDIDKYLQLLKQALVREKADFCGIIYSGLMLTKEGVKILEYNMRFGDPETQPILTHMKSDLLEIFVKATEKKLDQIELKWNNGKTFCVVLAAEGYPENPKKGAIISQVREIQQDFGVKVFYAGVKKENSNLIANGGRVLTICKTGANALSDIYKSAEKLNFKDKYFRTDIGANS